ncbi:hypothetical protein PHAMO_180093 [Magnetospirillum molischianum DSM 120]|uniref:Uncharacterized protein n=1 Tax=Magnetospirillum molischianum DSM 120 TaxID=1150626 RepID=H8FP36_MAGML|nr:hypothetical protein PHAMO_180093 [Magnetospirillum molischianum DSM 120]
MTSFLAFYTCWTAADAINRDPPLILLQSVFTAWDLA